MLGGGAGGTTPAPPVAAGWALVVVGDGGMPVPPAAGAAEAEDAPASANSAKPGIRNRCSGKSLSFVSRRG